ncbi:hypothetical protein K461DRAFT_27257 [Myriangium duriaei CBS 260.36]|uniref:Uncharacterized protein n=1 Tax=Myriangium duriaei CBS 260.36 TaxID=1168546 RepID=A0A9P4MM47_9PEZI|nr:hypothetical protein K461DRAFT_27257 [Myriangium duriaei CBS 260.36]
MSASAMVYARARPTRNCSCCFCAASIGLIPVQRCCTRLWVVGLSSKCACSTSDLQVERHPASDKQCKYRPSAPISARDTGP